MIHLQTNISIIICWYWMLNQICWNLMNANGLNAIESKCLPNKIPTKMYDSCHWTHNRRKNSFYSPPPLRLLPTSTCNQQASISIFHFPSNKQHFSPSIYFPFIRATLIWSNCDNCQIEKLFHFSLYKNKNAHFYYLDNNNDKICETKSIKKISQKKNSKWKLRSVCHWHWITYKIILSC